MKLTVKVLFFLTFGLQLEGQKLHTYETFFNHWEIEGFMNQFQRSFDKEGVVMQKNQYHPLILSFYGIINYHEFVKTGDSLYFKRTLDQYKFFKDSNNLSFFKDGGIGLPYDYNYSDLKSPWYSGMTQGTAVSFLLRYYLLTSDNYALELSKGLVNFMVKSEEEGGTIGRTNEGLLWIEEYPNSRSSKSVLNGFLNGLVGLKEYLDFFPQEQKVKAIHDSCYFSLFKSLKFYDSPDWTYYNRNKKSISKGYLRYQLSEFDHLHKIYEDDRFLYQMMIWAKFENNKVDTELKFYKHPSYLYGRKLNMDQSVDRFMFSETSKFNASLRPLKNVSITSSRRKIKIDLPSKTHFIKVESDEPLNESFEIKGYSKNREIMLSESYNKNYIELKSTDCIEQLEISGSKRQLRKLNLMSLIVYDYQNYILPRFGIVELPEIREVKKGERIKVQSYNSGLVNPRVFIRYAKSREEINKTVFTIENSFHLNDEYVINEDGFINVFIGYEIALPTSVIESIKIIQLN